MKFPLLKRNPVRRNMPSTDVDGSAMLILSAKDAEILLKVIDSPATYTMTTTDRHRIYRKASEVVEFEKKRKQSCGRKQCPICGVVL